jgi:hypothetical protein
MSLAVASLKGLSGAGRLREISASASMPAASDYSSHRHPLRLQGGADDAVQHSAVHVSLFCLSTDRRPPRIKPELGVEHQLLARDAFRMADKRSNVNPIERFEPARNPTA